MVPVTCRSNLDLYGEQWPSELPFRPIPGDLIQSRTIRSSGHGLELQVVRVTFRTDGGCWWAEVELHLPPHRFESLSQFEDWYRRLTSGHPHP